MFMLLSARMCMLLSARVCMLLPAWMCMLLLAHVYLLCMCLWGPEKEVDDFPRNILEKGFSLNLITI